MIGTCVRVRPIATVYKYARCSSASSTMVHADKSAESPRNRADLKPFKDIPGPLSLPFIGSLLNYLPLVGKYNLRKFHDSNYKKFLKYGKIVREDLPGNKNFVFLFDPEDIKQLIQHEGTFPKRRPFDSYATYWKLRQGGAENLGLFIEHDQKWYDLRSKVQVDLLKLNMVARYIPGMEDISTDMTHRIAYIRDHQGEIPNFLNELYKWALENIALVALDTRLGCLAPNLSSKSETQQMIDAVYTVFEESWNLELSLKLWKYFPTPAWRRYAKALNYQARVSEKYIKKAVERLNNTDPNERDDITFLESFLVKIPNKETALRMVQDMLLAGIDTTAHTAGFALYLLAKNPDVQEKVYREVKAVLPSVGDRLTASKKNELRYLKACLKETLRIFPILDYSREIPKDMELGGYLIPKGSNLVVQNQVLSNMEKYFPEVNKFKPERWLNREEKAYEPFAYLPFGFGPRMCVGRRISEQEVIILLAKAVQRFRIEYHHEDIGIRFRILNMPDKPLRLKFVDRDC